MRTFFTYLFWGGWQKKKTKTKTDYAFLREWFDYEPHDVKLFEKALTHRSGKNEGNEQLEYLGDAVITLVVADVLYKCFPHSSEGFLTRTRSKMVCRENLNKVAQKIGIPKHIITSNPLKQNAVDIYGNTFEALVGAVWLDGGYEKAEHFLRKWLIGRDNQQVRNLASEETDYKSRLLEWGQTTHQKIEFVLLSERYEKAKDRHIFVYAVNIEDTPYAQGAGYNKLEAQQIAARNTYRQLKKAGK